MPLVGQAAGALPVGKLYHQPVYAVHTEGKGPGCNLFFIDG